jgi:hypothetical protein
LAKVRRMTLSSGERSGTTATGTRRGVARATGAGRDPSGAGSRRNSPGSSRSSSRS